MFVSPPLEKGQRYHYTIRASWMENGKEVSREKKVDVEPGREFTVNFSQRGDEAPSGIAQPDQRRNGVGAEEQGGLRPGRSTTDGHANPWRGPGSRTRRAPSE